MRLPHRISRPFAACALACWLGATLSGSPRTPRADTASLSGVVVLDDTDPRPLRRVSVTVTSPSLLSSRLAVTDDEGRFAFTQLPAGRFTITAARVGYIKAAYGATRGWRSPGVPIALADGQQLSGMTIRMLKGAAITGRITDRFGQPASELEITVGEVRTVNGQPTLKPAPTGTIETDDRGIYRAFGLPPGDYIVSAVSHSPAELLESQSPPESLGYVSTYFPGTADPSLAATVTVGPGEERIGVDFLMTLVHMSTLSGTISAPAGTELRSVLMLASPASRLVGLQGSFPPIADVDTSGRFTMKRMTPGHYTLFAVGENLFGLAEVDIGGGDVSGVNVSMRPGSRVSGRIVFENQTTPPTAGQLRTQVRLAPPPGPMTAAITPQPVAIKSDGTFTIDNVAPGPFVISAVPPVAGGDAAVWTLKGAVAAGRDVLRSPIDVRPGEPLGGIVLTLTDRAAEISGRLLDPAGRPAPEYYVLAFPQDRTLWPLGGTRLAAPVRPSSDGRYRLAGLLAGAYYIAAVIDMQSGDEFDPAFLELLVPGAIKVTVGDGEKKIQEIRLAGG